MGIQEAKAAKRQDKDGSATKTAEVTASATNVTTSSDVPRSRELKPEFKQAVDVFTPPQLGLKNNAIKDAFTNLMLAIQDLDTAVGAGSLKALCEHCTATDKKTLEFAQLGDQPDLKDEMIRMIHRAFLSGLLSA